MDFLCYIGYFFKDNRHIVCRVPRGLFGLIDLSIQEVHVPFLDHVLHHSGIRAHGAVLFLLYHPTYHPWHPSESQAPTTSQVGRVQVTRQQTHLVPMVSRLQLGGCSSDT